MTIDWTYSGIDIALATYTGSFMGLDYLILSYFKNSVTSFIQIRLETGGELLNTISPVFTEPDARILSIQSAGEYGIYAFVKSTQSTVDKYMIKYIGLSDTDPKTILFRESKDVPYDYCNIEAFESFNGNIPSRMYLYYRNTNETVPGIILAGHLNTAEGSIGLLLYGFYSLDSTKTDYLMYSYNPFASMSDTWDIESEVNVNQSASNFITCGINKNFQNFKCNSGGSCPDPYYAKSTTCLPCHFTCSKCKGPSSSDCISCQSPGQIISELGQCFDTNSKTNGVYVPGGSSGSMLIYKFGKKRNSCPPFAFNVITDFSNVFKSAAETTGNYTQQSSLAVTLNGPTSVTSMPNEFTIGLWMKFTLPSIPSTQVGTLLSVFGNLKLTVKDNKLIIYLAGSSTESYTIPITWNHDASLPIDLASNTDWNYIAVSLKNSALGYDITPFVSRYYKTISDGSFVTEINSFTRSSPIPLNFAPYVNNIVIGHDSSNPISGLVRDVMFMPKYLTKDEINSLRTLTYNIDMQISQFVYYWPLFPIVDSKASDITGALKVQCPTEFNNLASDKIEAIRTAFNGAKGYESRLGILGSCFDLFSYSKFPAFSFDTLNFAGNELQPKINVNSLVLLGAVIKKGDTMKLTYGGCDSLAETLTMITVTLNVVDKAILTQAKRLPMKVRGTYVDACYCNPRCLWLGRTYFPLLPTQIHPAHGTTEKKDDTPIQFELRGGDQSYGDKLTLVNIEKDVTTAISETIIVDEHDTGYSAYSTVRRTNGVYDNLIAGSFDPGVYTVAWRPSYMSYLVDEKNVIYKNLYTTWALQDPPKVKFPPLAGVAGEFKRSIDYLNEFFYLELVGNGQSDGDQIIFCNTGCNYPYIQGGVNKAHVFQRENNRYPPIWFGKDLDVVGVGGISSADPLSERLFICWRPAARSNYIPPEDDLWTQLEDLQRPRENAYVIINTGQAATDANEIKNLSLPIRSLLANRIIGSPVLFQGDTLWFYIRGANMKLNGRVEIAHVSYDSNDKSSYTLDYNVWEEKFYDINNVKKIRNSNSNFTLQEIPYSTMKPGHDYMLIIYSDSFDKFGKSGVMEPQFKYLFRYQESVFDTRTFTKLAPIVTDLTITGTNFGNINIPGNGFIEARKLFGVAVDIVTTPPCGINPIKIGYIPGTIEDNLPDLVFKDIDLTSCTTVDVLSINLKLIKIDKGSTIVPMWSTTNTSSRIPIGSVSCDPSCVTCSGPTSFECLTCSISSYLYKNRCLSRCESDQPNANIIFKSNSYTIDRYECTKDCGPGFYLDTSLGLCMECSFECGRCSSGKPMACSNCKGTYQADPSSIYNYMNLYKETFFFKGMCLLNCPIVRNSLTDLIASQQNVVSVSNYNHVCKVNETFRNNSLMEVRIQPPIYPERVNIKKSIRLRALLDDLRAPPISNPLSAEYQWNGHEPEVLLEDLYTSDRRVFQNYSDENIKRSITIINMNAFNYKSDNDQMRLIVKAWDNTLKLFNFDMIELFGNRPPEIDDKNVVVRITDGIKAGTIATTSVELTTMNTIDITISEVQDSDDYFPILKYKVLLIPRSLVLPNPLPETVVTPESALSLLAQLSEQVLIVYSNKQVAPSADGSIVLKDIYIPPLINGEQVISKSDQVSSNKVNCDLFLYIEDRHSGASKVKFIYSIFESYQKDMDSILDSLIANMTAKVVSKTLNWDDILRISHIFRTINPEHTMYYMFYGQCARDDQCLNDGKCMTSGGWSECMCDFRHTGVTCGWKLKNMLNEQLLVDIVMDYLKTTLLIPMSGLTHENILDINVIDQLANVLTGLLKNPEIVDKKYLKPIVDLTWYMTRMDYLTGGRMEDFERSNVFTALDQVIKFVYYRLKEDIFKYFVLGEQQKDNTDSQKAEYIEMRQELVSTVKKLRDALYTFVDSNTLIQYPNDPPFALEYDTFEVFIVSQTEDKFFEQLKDRLGIQLSSKSEYIRIPPTFMNSLRNNISLNEEFKLKVIKWKENPYVFSEFTTEVYSPVYNFAILDSDSKVITTKLAEPIVIFMPMSGFTKNLPEDEVRCRYFDETNTRNAIVKTTEKINVNRLELSDEEKTALFPEWNAEFYHSKNLIIEKTNYTTMSINYPEFVDAGGMSSYGNILKTTEYESMIPCAAYNSTEIAAVAERRPSAYQASNVLPFYYVFDPLTNIYMNVGTYVCIVLGTLFIICMVISYVMDVILMPNHIKLILFNRPEYLEKESGESNISSNILLSVNYSGNDMSDGREEDVKMDDTSPQHRGKKVHGKRKLIKKLKHKGKGVNDNSSSNAGISNAKDTSADEKLNNNLTTTSGVNQWQTRAELKEGGDINTTTQVRTTTQELVGNTSNWSVLDTQKKTTDDQKFKNLFANVQPGDTIKMGKINGQDIENIFTPEYVARQEAEEFTFSNIYITSNPLLNIITRTSTIFTRPARTFTLFSYIYFVLFWAAIFISTTSTVLTQPEQTNDIMFLLTENVWIMFVCPILASILTFLVAGVFKVDESRIQSARTARRYKQVMYISMLIIGLNIDKRFG